MENGFDFLRLSNLLESIHEITRLKASIYDQSGAKVYSTRPDGSFCDLISDEKTGCQRCLNCGKDAIDQVSVSMSMHSYRCHAGLIESVIPIAKKGKIVAYVMLGQILNDSHLIAQWEVTKSRCVWHPRQEELKEAFLRLPRFSGKQITACYQIINAYVNEIRMEGLLKSEIQSDQERLKAYIRSRYALPLTTDSIAEALSINKSRLYMIASQMEDGLTVNQLITKQRISVAMQLLSKPGASIREVAEMVGIPDFNYFTKVFKRQTGMTPSQYRKEQRR